MTQIEIKDWLEWFAKNFNYSFSTIGDLYKRDSWEIYAFKMSYGYVVEEAFQLVLQEEIAIQGWGFSIEAYEPDEPFEVNIYTPKYDPNAQNVAFSHNLIHAFMLAFRQAWEATR